MALIREIFSTPIYAATLKGAAALNQDLARTCRMIAREDGAGQAWSRRHDYRGYTSYASLDDLPWRASLIDELMQRIAPHVAEFARACAFDLRGRKLVMDSLWINILEPGGTHSGHIHPGSAVSGTYYVAVPKGSGALRFEDPRLGLMMAAPKRRETAPPTRQNFIHHTPKAGEVVLWESWLRHEVMPNNARTPRISISFNWR